MLLADARHKCIPGINMTADLFSVLVGGRARVRLSYRVVRSRCFWHHGIALGHIPTKEGIKEKKRENCPDEFCEMADS